MIDFRRMRWLIRKAGEAYNKWQEAEAAAVSIGSPRITDMPRSRDVGNPVERAVIKVEQVYDAYRETLQELQAMREELGPLIDELPDPDDKAIMRLRYMQGYSPEIIADSNLFPLGRRAVYNHLVHAEQVINCRRAQNG